MRHGDTMRYLGTTAAQRAEMLRTVGVADVEALLERIPAKARLARELDVPAALAEGDLVAHLRDLAARHAHAEEYASFLGAGAYDHYIPSVINHLLLRGEFFIAYTPYQPEASQGTLRTIYEINEDMARLPGFARLHPLTPDEAAQGALQLVAVLGDWTSTQEASRPSRDG
jgi:glycine dehydrogenase subunit 1